MESLDPRLQGLDFSKIPISQPPPGVVSNFENPPSIAGAVIAIGVIMVVLTMSFVMLRLYSNHHAKRKFCLDDCTISIPRNSCGYTRPSILIARRYVYPCNNLLLGGHRR